MNFHIPWNVYQILLDGNHLCSYYSVLLFIFLMMNFFSALQTCMLLLKFSFIIGHCKWIPRHNWHLWAHIWSLDIHICSWRLHWTNFSWHLVWQHWLSISDTFCHRLTCHCYNSPGLFPDLLLKTRTYWWSWRARGRSPCGNPSTKARLWGYRGSTRSFKKNKNCQDSKVLRGCLREHG